MTLQLDPVAPDLAQAPSDGDRSIVKGLAGGRRDPFDHRGDSAPPCAAAPGKADPTLEAPAGTWGY